MYVWRLLLLRRCWCGWHTCRVIIAWLLPLVVALFLRFHSRLSFRSLLLIQINPSLSFSLCDGSTRAHQEKHGPSPREVANVRRGRTVGKAVKSRSHDSQVFLGHVHPASRTSSAGTVLAIRADAAGCNARTAVTPTRVFAVLFAAHPPSLLELYVPSRLPPSHQPPPHNVHKEPRADNLSLHACK